MQSTELVIIMPAYNEEEAISDVVEEWHQVAEEFKGNLAVINDGSSDSTLRKLHEFRDRFPRMIIIDKLNSGHGQSCMSGYRWAIENNYKWIFQTDSDGQAGTDEFSLFWKAREKEDFIFGHRPSRGDGFLRLVISRALQGILYVIFRTFVKDSNVPYRLMKASALAPLLKYIPQDFFLANALLSVVLSKHGKIKWIPIYFGPRSGGVPSVPLKKFFILGLKVTSDLFKLRKTI